MPLKTVMKSILASLGFYFIWNCGWVSCYPMHMYQTYGNGHVLTPQNTYQDLRMNPASNVNGYHVNRDMSWIGGGQPLNPWANTAPSMPYTHAAMSPYATKLSVLPMANRLSGFARPALRKVAVKMTSNGGPTGGALTSLRLAILRRRSRHKHHQSLFDQLVP